MLLTRPLLLRVENVQCGREVKDVLQSLFESNLAESCPILVVVTHRDRFAEHTSPSRAPQWLQQSRRYSQINLGPLSRSEREELTKELCSEGKLAVQVEQLCGGNPMFAIELKGLGKPRCWKWASSSVETRYRIEFARLAARRLA